MRKEIKALLKAIEDNTIDATVYKDEVHSVVPIQYISGELEAVREELKKRGVKKATDPRMNDIEQNIFCERCNKLIPRQFRFTDWEHDENDSYGNLQECFHWFDEAVYKDPKGNYSIYAVTICECDSAIEDEGVYFNERYSGDYLLEGGKEQDELQKLC